MSAAAEQSEFARGGNPFSSRWIRPGAQAYLFPPGESLGQLIEQLRLNAWWAEIVGPHGSGKSTLVAQLCAAIDARERTTVLFALHDRERRLPTTPADRARWDARTVVVVDGYEQLSWLSRVRLKYVCRRRVSGLLITSHGSQGFAPLVQTIPRLETARVLVRRLLQNAPALASINATPISDADVERCFAAAGGNLREMLFALYDLYEQRQPYGSAISAK